MTTPSLSTVTIGTPLQSSATKVLLLGSGELGKEVVISLQRLGVEVHAADRYKYAPAMQVAHTAHVLDMTDPIALHTLIDTVSPTYIVPEIEAIATSVLTDIEAASIATIVPSAKAVNLTMNRQGIRHLAAKTLGLKTSPYAFADSLETLTKACHDIGFPCFVKPVMSSSGKGQSRLRSVTDVETAWHIAQQAGRVQQADLIVEGQVDFDIEITLLTVRAKDADGQIQTYFCDPIAHRQQDGDYIESWQSADISKTALDTAQDMARQVTQALCDELEDTSKGGLGVFGVEFFIKGDTVWFSELSPRPHDAGLVTLASQYQSEFELHARAILGLPVNTVRHSAAASHVIHAGIDGDNLTYANINQALAHPDVDIRLFGKPNGTPNRRMGVVTARANSCLEARQLASEAVALLTIQRHQTQINN